MPARVTMTSRRGRSAVRALEPGRRQWRRRQNALTARTAPAIFLHWWFWLPSPKNWPHMVGPSYWEELQ